jgi:cytoskeletal protein CcmA (bactofilin family)
MAAQRENGSFLAADLTICGTLHAQRQVTSEARIEGDIHATHVALGKRSTVLGTILADEVTVAGVIEGDVEARHVQLGPSARVKGDISYAENLCIAAGALYEGRCRRAATAGNAAMDLAAE